VVQIKEKLKAKREKREIEAKLKKVRSHSQISYRSRYLRRRGFHLPLVLGSLEINEAAA
jgi:hypothetical protein